MLKQLVHMSLGMVIAALLAGCAVVARPAVPAPLVPDALAVTEGEYLTTAVAAEGVQIYVCKPAVEDATKSVWTFSAPEAVLYDGAGHAFGRHYAGPTWEADDGSKVVAEVKARADAPDADAVPWLLLTTKATKGLGVFTEVTSIRRIETTGGRAPAAGCDAAHHGAEARVPYTAVYYFYAMR